MIKYMTNYYMKTHVPGFNWIQWIAIYKYKVDAGTSFLEKVYYNTNSFHFKVFICVLDASYCPFLASDNNFLLIPLLSTNKLSHSQISELSIT